MELNTSLIQDLKRVGLSDKEAQVYATVLDLGSAFPSKIAEVTKLNRTTIYKILLNLSVKGLVTEIEKNKKICYQAERPSKLVSYAKSRIQMAEDGYERAKKILPEIEGVFSLVPNKPKVRFFEGMDGILEVYSTQVDEIKPYEQLAFSNVEDLIKIMPDSFVKYYVRRKNKVGITTRAIFPDNKFSREYNKRIYAGSNKKILINTKLIPVEMFPYKGEVTIYGHNRVSIVNFHEKVLIGVIIEDKTIADMMRMVFELAWAGADKFQS